MDAGPSHSGRVPPPPPLNLDLEMPDFPSSDPPSSGNGQYPCDEVPVDVIPTKQGRKLCVRHKQMANQGVNEKLQKSLDSLPQSERLAVTQLWATFSKAKHPLRKLILEGILTMCCFSQLSHLSDSLNQIIRIDPFSLLPREVNLRILGYLDAISLGRAAQVSKSWKALADDDLLWRRMCGQHIDRKCEKCGWGLPLLERKRLKVELSHRSPMAAVGIGGHKEHSHHRHSHGHSHEVVMTRKEAMGEMSASSSVLRSEIPLIHCDTPVQDPIIGVKRSAPVDSGFKAKKAKVESDSEGESSLDTKKQSNGSNGHLTREVRLTRPWKTVYCERLLVERNWRKGRCTTKTLKGHTDGVMCLQYHTALSDPSYPVLITGSYDRTARVWNLATGEEVRVMRGHERAIRCLQFDQMFLFTGSMDGIVKVWNWRAGECIRTFECHTDSVITLHYNGYLLATGSADSTIQVFNFRTSKKFHLRGHEDWVNSVVLWDGKSSPNDVDPSAMMQATIARHRSPGPDGIEGDAKPRRPDIEPGTMLFSASDDNTIILWDLDTQTQVRRFEGHKAQVQSIKVVMLDMSAEELAQAQQKHEQGNTRNQRHRSTSPLVQFTNGHRAPTPPSSRLAIESPALENAPEGFDPISHMDAPKYSAVEPRVFVHKPEEPTPAGKGKRRDRETVEKIDPQQVVGKKPVLATGSLDGTVRLWDVETGEEKATLFGHIEGVWGVDIDALRIASASHDRTVKVWDISSGQCMQTLVGHRGAVTSVQLSDDFIVSASDDGDVMVWSFAPPAGASNGGSTPTPAPLTPGGSGEIGSRITEVN